MAIMDCFQLKFNQIVKAVLRLRCFHRKPLVFHHVISILCQVNRNQHLVCGLSCRGQPADLHIPLPLRQKFILDIPIYQNEPALGASFLVFLRWEAEKATLPPSLVNSMVLLRILISTCWSFMAFPMDWDAMVLMTMSSKIRKTISPYSLRRQCFQTIAGFQHLIFG